MDAKIPVTVKDFEAAIEAADEEEAAAHERAKVLRQCLRARLRYDAQRAEADAALAERVAAAGKAS